MDFGTGYGPLPLIIHHLKTRWVFSKKMPVFSWPERALQQIQCSPCKPCICWKRLQMESLWPGSKCDIPRNNCHNAQPAREDIQKFRREKSDIATTAYSLKKKLAHATHSTDNPSKSKGWSIRECLRSNILPEQIIAILAHGNPCKECPRSLATFSNIHQILTNFKNLNRQL